MPTPRSLKDALNASTPVEGCVVASLEADDTLEAQPPSSNYLQSVTPDLQFGLSAAVGDTLATVSIRVLPTNETTSQALRRNLESASEIVPSELPNVSNYSSWWEPQAEWRRLAKSVDIAEKYFEREYPSTNGDDDSHRPSLLPSSAFLERAKDGDKEEQLERPKEALPGATDEEVEAVLDCFYRVPDKFKGPPPLLAGDFMWQHALKQQYEQLKAGAAANGCPAGGLDKGGFRAAALSSLIKGNSFVGAPYDFGLPLFEEGEGSACEDKNGSNFLGSRDRVAKAELKKTEELLELGLAQRALIADLKGRGGQAALFGATVRPETEEAVVALAEAEKESVRFPPTALVLAMPACKLSGSYPTRESDTIKLHLGTRGCRLGARLTALEAAHEDQDEGADPSFWLEMGEGKPCVSRSVFIDTERDTGRSAVFGPRSLARGLLGEEQFVHCHTKNEEFGSVGLVCDRKKLCEAASDAIRLQVEMCDSATQGFVATRSFGDAGGAIGSVLFNDFLKTEFPKCPVLTFDLVSGHRNFPSSGSFGAFMEGMCVADLVAKDSIPNVYSAIISNEALYAHPDRVYNEAVDYCWDPEDRIVVEAMASVLSACSPKTCGACGNLSSLLSAASPEGRATNLLGLSLHAQKDRKIWSAATSVGKGSLSPWEMKEPEGNAPVGCVAISRTQLAEQEGSTAFKSSLNSLGGDFVSTLFSPSPKANGRCHDWTKFLQRNFKYLYDKRAFVQHIVGTGSEDAEVGEWFETLNNLEKIMGSG